MIGIGWNEAEDERLRALWASGMPTLAIGEAMARSKSSIVGRAHRLQLPDRPSPIQRGVERKRLRVKPAVPKLVELTATVPAPVAPRPVVLVRPSAPVTVAPRPAVVPGVLAVRGPCRFPLWGRKERPTHRYCEAPAVGPYCAAHRAICFVAPRPAAVPFIPARFAHVSGARR